MIVKTRYGDITIRKYKNNEKYDYIVSIRGLYVSVRKENDMYIFEEYISNTSYISQKKDNYKSDEDFIIESLIEHLRNRVIDIQNIINMLIEARRK